MGSTDDKDIDSIEIIDDRTIMIDYRQELTSSVFEYKLLAESRVMSIQKLDYYSPELIITVEPPFVSNQDYILMFIDMQDIEGNYLEFDTGIYDFTTPELSMEEQDENEDTYSDTGSGETMQDDLLEVIELPEDMNDNQEEDIMEDEIIEDDMSEDDIDLQAAGDEVSLEKDGDTDMDIEQAAELVTETPDTGAETWVLVFLTLVINSIYYLSRRKQRILTA